MIPTPDGLDLSYTRGLTFPTFDEIAALLTADPVADPVAFRFFQKIELGTVPEHAPWLGPCIIWTRARDTTGYGTMWYRTEEGKPKQGAAHIYLFRRLNGRDVRPGYELDHVCHEGLLCHPEKQAQCPHRICVLHSVETTINENRRRHLGTPGRNHLKKHCEGRFSPRDPETGAIIGHDWSIPENVYRVPGTSKIGCVPCRAAERRDYERNGRKRLRAKRAAEAAAAALT